MSAVNHDRSFRLRRLLLGLLILLTAMLPAAAAFAQEPTLDEINAVAKKLYCPLCNGVRLDTCDLQACIQMRQVIADNLAAGVPEEQIRAEFVAQYGPVVLGEPPRQGLDLLAWILPVVALLAGAGWLFLKARGWSQRPAPATAGQAPRQPPAPPPGQKADDYLMRVESDLADLE